jgi:hypothetical protein
MTRVKQAIAGAAMLGLAVIVPIRAGATASAAEIAHMPWDEANISTLRPLDRDSIERFVNSPIAYDLPKGEGPLSVVLPTNVLQFGWADFGGNGRYSLVVVSGGQAEGITVFEQNASGKIDHQDIDLEGYGHEEWPLMDKIRDLNGDGKKELLINAGFGTGRSMAETPLTQWPMIYRLHGGKLVEASREFPGFYDREVLPPLEAKIAALEKKLNSEAEAKAAGEAVIKEYSPSQPDIDSHTSPEQRKAVRDSEQLALQQSLRDHILHVLGRNLTAEQEKEALAWLNSPDYWVLKYAEPTLEGMGGSRR